MFRPESPRSRFGKPNFILGWIASVDSEISIIDLLGVRLPEAPGEREGIGDGGERVLAFGYEHTSLDVLMREMGIARQSLYELATNGPCTCGR
jgi:hypothetical protein